MKTAGKYVAVFVITSLMFVTAFLMSRELNNERTINVGAIRDDIALNLSADEVNFALLRNSPCSSVNRTLLADELNDLGGRISVLAANRGWEDEEVMRLRKQYLLLQVQDYLLTKEMSTRCETDAPVIMAFVRDANCDACQKIRLLLTDVQAAHPEARLYTIDTGVDIEVGQTLMQLYGVDADHLPAIFIDDTQVSEGQMTAQGMEAYFHLPEEDAGQKTPSVSK